MKPDLDAIRARCDAATPGPWAYDEGAGYIEMHEAGYAEFKPDWERSVHKQPPLVARMTDTWGDTAEDGRFIAHARTDIPALLAYIEELESRVTYTVGETEWTNRVAVAEQRFADECDAHQETRTRLTDLYMKQLKADAAQMREYGISYDGVRTLIAECVDDEMNVGKVVELLRAAAREMAKGQLDELREECTHLKHREVMLKRAHGALADAGCVVPIEIDRTIEHAINALAERALTAEERLERVTHERDQERKVFEQAMAEAQTDVMELRVRITTLEAMKT